MLQKVDAQSVDHAISEFFQTLLPNSTSPVAVDGKTIKGAKQADGLKVHLLSAFLHKEGAVIAQTVVQNKTNEIPLLPALLEPLDIKDRVVTADAMHTQIETAKFIKEKKQAEYLFITKDNQKNLKQDISDLNLVAFPPQRQTVEKGHGRIEIRQIRTSDELNGYLDFPYVKQVFCIHREFTYLKTNKITTETVYGLTSLSKEKADPKLIRKFPEVIGVLKTASIMFVMKPKPPTILKFAPKMPPELWHVCEILLSVSLIFLRLKIFPKTGD